MNLGSEQILPEDFYLAEEGALLEEMAEEDEEIDLYNEVTFGLDQESDEEPVKLEDDHTKPIQMPEAPKEEEPEALQPVKEAKGSEKAPLHEVKIVVEPHEDHVDLSIDSGGHTMNSTMDDSELGDPAVMKAFHGKPTLESLDSAVVDSGIGSTWSELDTDYDQSGMDSGLWEASPKVSTYATGQILEDKAILRIMERAPYLPPTNLEFLGSPLQRGFMPSQRLQGPEMGAMSPKPYRPRFMRQQSPLVPRSMRPSYPFTPPRRGPSVFAPNQSPGFVSQTPFRPMSPNVSTPTRPMTPKMVRMHFGPMSPSPSFSPFFSPMGNALQRFKVPGHVTQLHPQHRRILSQRQRPQSSSRRQWESRPDPYASLMSQKEKEWVIKLQMIQLQSENPHLDDYYYQAYYENLERKLSEEEFLGERKKREPTKLVTPYIQKAETYESVVHIEGSLGQVAVSTCYSPRRAIDAVSYAMPDEAIKALGYQRLRVLKHAEKVFLMFLEVEELARKMSHIPEEEHVHFQHKQNYKVQRIYDVLKIAPCHNEEESEFLQLLQVGKGKKLVARLLPFLRSEQAREILLLVVQHLTFLIKNDSAEESLSVLYGPLKPIINGLSFTELIGVTQELTRPLPESNDLPLTLAFQNQFGISLLYCLLSHGERLLSSDLPMEPCIGDFEKWTDTVFLVAKELSHVSKSSMVEPLFLPSNLLSLFCRYLDKQTIHKLEDKMECPVIPPYTAVPS
ncbi:protein PAT1 homolog 2 isoform X1 [Xenopus laevis]|uniref:Protein PAT1 homolog 2 isoform X1 n=1 Tax=Xenopus laevis TaxID=8355 RepID=A0A8J0U3S6_XENLA|nr:protein PAT1 homolog 2 isoform X1 [Xenopus laevis]